MDSFVRVPPAVCDLTGKHVLVVDDSLINLKMVCMLFKRFGAICVQASDGAQAVEIIRQSLVTPAPAPVHVSIPVPVPTAGYVAVNGSAASQRTEQQHRNHNASFSSSSSSSSVVFDMVIMDNLMPVMNGLEACKIMRDLGFTGLIFGLTGIAQQESIDLYVDAGANFVFKKPIDLTEFKFQMIKFAPSSLSPSLPASV